MGTTPGDFERENQTLCEARLWGYKGKVFPAFRAPLELYVSCLSTDGSGSVHGQYHPKHALSFYKVFNKTQTHTITAAISNHLHIEHFAGEV